MLDVPNVSILLTASTLGYVIGRGSVAIAVGYVAFRLIAKQKKIYSKPRDMSERPRWFLALWVFHSVLVVIFTPVSSNDYVDQMIIRLIFFSISLSGGMVGYYIYKYIAKKEIAKRAIASDNSSQQTSVENTADKPITEDDSEFFLQATQEVDSGSQKPAMWAKAMALSEGDKAKARYEYINLCVKDMVSEVAGDNETSALSTINIQEPREGDGSRLKESSLVTEQSEDIAEELKKALAIATQHMKDNRR